MRVSGNQARSGRQAVERVTAEIRADMELTEHGCILYEREQADSTFILRPLGAGGQGQESGPCPPSLPPSQSSRYQFSVATEASTYGGRRSRQGLVAGAVVGLLMAAAVFLGLVLHFANLRREWAGERRTAAVPVPRADDTSSVIRAAFDGRMTVTSYAWDERLADRASALYRHMAFHVEQELDKLFLGSPMQDIYNYSVVRSIGPDDGVVVVGFQIAVKQSHAITAPELAALMKGALRHRLRHQGSSRLTFDPQSVVIFPSTESAVNDIDMTVKPYHTVSTTESGGASHSVPERLGNINSTSSEHEHKSEIRILNSTELGEEGDVNLLEVAITSATTNSLKNLSYDHEQISTLPGSVAPDDLFLMATRTSGQELSPTKAETHLTLRDQKHGEEDTQLDENDQDAIPQRSTVATGSVTQRSTVSSSTAGPRQITQPTHGSPWPTLYVTSVSDVGYGDDTTSIDVVTSSGPLGSTSNSRERERLSTEITVATRVPSFSHEASTPAAESSVGNNSTREFNNRTTGIKTSDAADADVTHSLIEQGRFFERSETLDREEQDSKIALSENDLRMNETRSLSVLYNNKTNEKETRKSEQGGHPANASFAGIPDSATATIDNDVEFPWPDPDNTSFRNSSSAGQEEREQSQWESSVSSDGGRGGEMWGLGREYGGSQGGHTGSDAGASTSSSGSGDTGDADAGDTLGRAPAWSAELTPPTADHDIPRHAHSANDTDTGDSAFREGRAQMDARPSGEDGDHVDQSGSRGVSISASVTVISRHGNSSTHAGFPGTRGSVEPTAASNIAVPSRKEAANESMSDVLESNSESNTSTLGGDGKILFTAVNDIDMTVKPYHTVSTTESGGASHSVPERLGNINSTFSEHEHRSEIRILNSTELGEEGDVNLLEVAITSATTNSLKNLSHDHEQISTLPGSVVSDDLTLLATRTSGQELSPTKAETHLTLRDQKHGEEDTQLDENGVMVDTEAGENSGGADFNDTVETVPGGTRKPLPDDGGGLHSGQRRGNTPERKTRPSDGVTRSGGQWEARDAHSSGDSATALATHAFKPSTNHSSFGSTLLSISMFNSSAITVTADERELTSPSTNNSTSQETEVFPMSTAPANSMKNYYYPQEYPRLLGRDNQTNSHSKDFGLMTLAEADTSNRQSPNEQVSTGSKTDTDGSFGENKTSGFLGENFITYPDHSTNDSFPGQEGDEAIQSSDEGDSSTESSSTRKDGQEGEITTPVTQNHTFAPHERPGQTPPTRGPGRNIANSTIRFVRTDKAGNTSGDNSSLITAKRTASIWSTVKGIDNTAGNSTQMKNESATYYSQDHFDDKDSYAESSIDTWISKEIEGKVTFPTDVHQLKSGNDSIGPDVIAVKNSSNNTLIELTQNITPSSSDNDDKITKTSLEHEISASGGLNNQSTFLSVDSRSESFREVNSTLVSNQTNLLATTTATEATEDKAIYANQSNYSFDGRYSLNNSTGGDITSPVSLSEETADSYREKVLSRPPKEPMLLASKSGGRFLRKEALSRKSTSILSPSLDVRPLERGSLRRPSPSPPGLLRGDVLPGLLDTPALGGDVGEDELGPDGLPQLPRERSAHVPTADSNGKPGRNRKLPALRTDAPWTVGRRKDKPLPTDGSLSFLESRKDLRPVVQPVGLGKHGIPVKVGGQTADGASGEAASFERTPNPLRMMHEAWRKGADVAPDFVDDSVERSTRAETLDPDGTNSLASLDIPRDFMQRSDVENLLKSVLRGTQDTSQHEGASQISVGDNKDDPALWKHEMLEDRAGEKQLKQYPQRVTSGWDAQQDERALSVDFTMESRDGSGFGFDEPGGSLSGVESSQGDGQHVGKLLSVVGKQEEGVERPRSAPENVQYSQPALAPAARAEVEGEKAGLRETDDAMTDAGRLKKSQA